MTTSQEEREYPPHQGVTAWFALVMGAAASLEDAANCLRDADAKKSAEGAARHYRERRMRYSPTAMSEPCPRDWSLCRRGYCQREHKCLDREALAPFSAPQASQPPQGAEPDYSELSREALERHAKRLWQAMETAHDFWHRHAIGPLAAPSCLCCGKLPDEVAIRHMELPGVVICKTCRNAALAASPPQPPQGAADPSERMLFALHEEVERLVGHRIDVSLSPALKAALAASPPPATQEPVGEVVMFGPIKEVSWRRGRMPEVGTKLYAAPAPVSPDSSHSMSTVSKGGSHE